jgi:hypothetical protein
LRCWLTLLTTPDVELVMVWIQKSNDAGNSRHGE